ncbi:hypothetical protein [Clostridium sp.]|uniref:hypothetical protein n=1 Tax=Clostridium sp. TaxID=1506 RepID=UPI002846366F|nr:hypothetical protein [Clostridium sp.]MDR3597839.1 hypothetical protein [Clostridium sp.]
MDNKDTFINEKTKEKAYKELMLELQTNLKNKIEEIEKMEIKYSKDYFLCESYVNNHDKYNTHKVLLKELIIKIEKERKYKQELEETINLIINKFGNQYGN